MSGTMNKAMLALTALGCVGTWVGALTNMGYGASIVPSAALAAISALFGCAFGWLLRSSVIVPERGTPHNELCRKMLSDLAELPKGERYPYVEKLLAHDRVDGSHATLNALESLVAQGCVRGCEVRWHLDGDAGFYADASFGPTGKRYVDD